MALDLMTLDLNEKIRLAEELVEIQIERVEAFKNVLADAELEFFFIKRDLDNLKKIKAVLDKEAIHQEV